MNRNYRTSRWYTELRDGDNNCIYCDEKLTSKTFTVDHIIPKSQGGEDSLDNCKPCCKFCNTLKSNMSITQFNEKYPKEKLIRLKKYTTIINGNKEEMLEELENKATEAYQLIREIKQTHKDILAMKSTYDTVSREINRQMALSDNLNASQGFQMYARQREVSRKVIKLEGDLSITHFFNTIINETSIHKDLQSICDKVKNKKHSVADKIVKPLVGSEIMEAIEAQLMINEDTEAVGS